MLEHLTIKRVNINSWFDVMQQLNHYPGEQFHKQETLACEQCWENSTRWTTLRKSALTTIVWSNISNRKIYVGKPIMCACYFYRHGSQHTAQNTHTTHHKTRCDYHFCYVVMHAMCLITAKFIIMVCRVCDATVRSNENDTRQNGVCSECVWTLQSGRIRTYTNALHTHIHDMRNLLLLCLAECLANSVWSAAECVSASFIYHTIYDYSIVCMYRFNRFHHN